MSTVHTIVEIIGWWFLASITAGSVIWLVSLYRDRGHAEPLVGLIGDQ